MAQVWQWALDADRDADPEQEAAALVAFENRASALDDESCAMFDDLFKSMPSETRPPKPEPAQHFMRLVRD